MGVLDWLKKAKRSEPNVIPDYPLKGQTTTWGYRNHDQGKHWSVWDNATGQKIWNERSETERTSSGDTYHQKDQLHPNRKATGWKGSHESGWKSLPGNKVESPKLITNPNKNREVEESRLAREKRQAEDAARKRAQEAERAKARQRELDQKRAREQQQREDAERRQRQERERATARAKEEESRRRREQERAESRRREEERNRRSAELRRQEEERRRRQEAERERARERERQREMERRRR